MNPHGFRAELEAMIRLALPIVVVQLGQMFMGFVDTVMVGRVSAEAAGAAARLVIDREAAAT